MWKKQEGITRGMLRRTKIVTYYISIFKRVVSDPLRNPKYRPAKYTPLTLNFLTHGESAIRGCFLIRQK